MTTRPSTPSPDDIHSLKALLLEKDRCLNEKDKRISLLEEQVRLLKHKRFAASSEKSDDQAELFNEAEAAEPVPEEDLNENTDDAETETIQYERRKPRGCKPLPVDWPRVRIEHDLNNADKVYECGCALTHIGEDTSEQLDIIPAKIQVLQHARLQYACKACESSTARTVALPAQPIPKSNASAGLLAFIATAKYQDALPLQRQENIFKRMEIDIPRNTLANWMMRSGELMTPLITRLDSELHRGRIIECDETPLQVLNVPDRPASSQSYMWVRRSGAPDHPVVLYDYAPSRTGSVAGNLLTRFSVYLQTDDHAGYQAVGRKHDISHLGCWAHARRKFIDAKKAAKDKKTGRTGKADVAINYIAKL
jgi:transposase